MSRPRSLDETKRREICALISTGCAIRQAARYVRCSSSTIHREAQRDPEFFEQLRRAEMHAQLNPLHAMQKAVATHWRAAAWFLERTNPECFARQDSRAFGPNEVRALSGDVTRILNQEILDPLVAERVVPRVKAAFQYAMHKAWDQQRTKGALRRAVELFERKERDSLLADLWGDRSPGRLLKKEPKAKSPNALLAEFCDRRASRLAGKQEQTAVPATQNNGVLQ